MASHVRPLLSLVGLVAAEQISFHEPVPEPLTLKVFRMMGVSASPDAPGYFQIAAHLEGGSATPSAMDGLQVIAAEKSWFDHYASKDSFCCTMTHISEGKCSKERAFVGASDSGPAYAFPVTTEKSKLTKLPLKEEGVFYIGIVHCGDVDLQHLSIVGSVQSRSSHGFLSGLDVQAMHFTGGVAAFYSLALGVWCYLCCKWRDQLVSVHYCLTIVLAVCFVASVAKWAMYSLGNHSELSATSAEVISELLGIGKFGVGLIAAVMISLGYGTAHEFVSPKELTWLLIYCVGFIFCAGLRILVSEKILFSEDGGTAAGADSALVTGAPAGEDAVLPSAIWEYVSPAALLVLPEALIFGAVANWGYTEIVALQATLEEQKQHETLKMMTGFYRTMRSAVVALVGVAVLQIVVQRSSDSADMWRFLWILDEGAPNVIYAACVGATLLSFWPSENFKAKAMSQQIQFDDNELDDMVIGNAQEDIMGDGDGIEMAEVGSADSGGMDMTRIEMQSDTSSPGRGGKTGGGKFLE